MDPDPGPALFWGTCKMTLKIFFGLFLTVDILTSVFKEICNLKVVQINTVPDPRGSKHRYGSVSGTMIFTV